MRNSLAVFWKRVTRCEVKLNICRDKQEYRKSVPELAEGQKTLDNVLCDSRNFFDCLVLIAQTNNIVTFIKEESCLLIAL